jgi:hypothetical protein
VRDLTPAEAQDAVADRFQRGLAGGVLDAGARRVVVGGPVGLEDHALVGEQEVGLVRAATGVDGRVDLRCREVVAPQHIQRAVLELRAGRRGTQVEEPAELSGAWASGGRRACELGDEGVVVDQPLDLRLAHRAAQGIGG